MTELEELEFPEPFGKMEAFQTSGGTSTLPDTFLGSVRELDYKTIRYPGHCAKFKTMIDLGLCCSEPITSTASRQAAPRPRRAARAQPSRTTSRTPCWCAWKLPAAADASATTSSTATIEPPASPR